MRTHFNQKNKAYKRAVLKVKKNCVKIVQKFTKDTGFCVHESTSVEPNVAKLLVHPGIH